MNAGKSTMLLQANHNYQERGMNTVIYTSSVDDRYGKKEIVSILYAGILSGGLAFVLQIYAQRNITPAPAAIIFSLEGVFATVAAWFLLNQILGLNNLLGCFFILCGVLLSQLLPLIKKPSNYKLL